MLILSQKFRSTYNQKDPVLKFKQPSIKQRWLLN